MNAWEKTIPGTTATFHRTQNRCSCLVLKDRTQQAWAMSKENLIRGDWKCMRQLNVAAWEHLCCSPVDILVCLLHTSRWGVNLSTELRVSWLWIVVKHKPPWRHGEVRLKLLITKQTMNSFWPLLKMSGCVDRARLEPNKRICKSTTFLCCECYFMQKGKMEAVMSFVTSTESRVLFKELQVPTGHV